MRIRASKHKVLVIWGQYKRMRRKLEYKLTNRSFVIAMNRYFEKHPEMRHYAKES